MGGSGGGSGEHDPISMDTTPMAVDVPAGPGLAARAAVRYAVTGALIFVRLSERERERYIERIGVVSGFWFDGDGSEAMRRREPLTAEELRPLSITLSDFREAVKKAPTILSSSF
jgi:hypothetical protein